MSEHAIREYLKTIGNGGGGAQQETDPVFTASPAHGISAQDILDWNDKQDELVSGTNIKTINGQSLLGSGDLPVAPPVTSTDVPTADTISEFDSDAHMNSTDMTAVQVDDFVDGLNVSSAGFPFAIEWKTLDFGSCRNQTDYTQTLDISKDGYNGWGIISWEIRGTWKTHFTITTMKINNWATLSCSIRSTNATSFTTDHTYVDVLVLYKRTT